MAKRQPNDYIKRRDVIRTMHEKRPSWGDSNYNFIRDIPGADVYTKDEVITMLTELQSEIEDNSYLQDMFDHQEKVIDLMVIYNIIQKKINTLKEKEDES